MQKSAASNRAISTHTFLQDVDAAIVVDRRGTRDIVTSYAGIVPFAATITVAFSKQPERSPHAKLKNDSRRI
jgi:hypothetical protein